MRFEPATRFDLPTTRLIFQPILDDVRTAADNLGIDPVRDVQLVTSTDITTSPAAMPTTGEHLLFIGLGTSSFCNYWSKVVTSVVTAIPFAHGLQKVAGTDDVRKILRFDPSGVALAGRLALHNAVYGTALGFGEVHVPNLPYRVQLLHAMETFAVAHEYSHFVAEEQSRTSGSALEADENRELELFCDALAIEICRDCADRGENFLGFAGIGAFVLLWAVELCQSVRTVLLGAAFPISGSTRHEPEESTHPAPPARIAAIKTRTTESTADDQKQWVQNFFEEYARILETVGTTVVNAVRAAASQG